MDKFSHGDTVANHQAKSILIFLETSSYLKVEIKMKNYLILAINATCFLGCGGLGSGNNLNRTTP